MGFGFLTEFTYRRCTYVFRKRRELGISPGIIYRMYSTGKRFEHASGVSISMVFFFLRWVFDCAMTGGSYNDIHVLYFISNAVPKYSRKRKSVLTSKILLKISMYIYIFNGLESSCVCWCGPLPCKGRYDLRRTHVFGTQ